MDITVEDAYWWRDSLTIDQKQAVNKAYEQYFNSTPLKYRIGYPDWLRNTHLSLIGEFKKNLINASNTATSSKSQDSEGGQTDAGNKSNEDYQIDEDTQNQDIETPEDEAQKKLTYLKIALALLSAGAVLVLL